MFNTVPAAAWIKLESFDPIVSGFDYSPILFKTHASDHLGWGFGVKRDGGLTLNINDLRFIESSSGLINPGQWYHVAVSFDDSLDRVEFFVNGVRVWTANGVTDTIRSSTEAFVVGAEDNTVHYFDGLVKDGQRQSFLPTADN